MAICKKTTRLFPALMLALALPALAAAAGRPADSGGRLVIIGGGEDDEIVMARLLELAGGRNARIVILPQASGEQLEEARAQAAKLTRLGAAAVELLPFPKGGADKPENLARLKNADAVFLTGGDQLRLLSFLAGTKLLEEIRRIYREGGVVSGTSAGAAVMSKVMLTGEDRLAGKDDEFFTAIRSGSVVTAEGFGFLPAGVVIDQHFLARKRQNRLISVLLEQPGLTAGIGIDENTALVAGPDGNCEVVGSGLVTVFETAQAVQAAGNGRGPLAARNIVMHLLKAGDKYVLPGAAKDE